jgi:hypothetical protein
MDEPRGRSLMGLIFELHIGKRIIIGTKERGF